jgi:hypothetical protein
MQVRLLATSTHVHPDATSARHAARQAERDGRLDAQAQLTRARQQQADAEGLLEQLR